MLEIEQNDVYLRSQISKINQPIKGTKHVVKKGESLWKLAEKALGKKSKNSEKADYMIKVAKLNKMNSQKELDNLNIGQVILLPVVSENDALAKGKSDIQPNRASSNRTSSALNLASPSVEPSRIAGSTSNNAKIAYDDFYNKLLSKNINVVESQNIYSSGLLGNKHLYQVYYNDPSVGKTSMFGRFLAMAVVKDGKVESITISHPSDQSKSVSNALASHKDVTYKVIGDKIYEVNYGNISSNALQQVSPNQAQIANKKLMEVINGAN